MLLSFKRILLIVALFFAAAGLFGAALYFGWIGHRSIDWQEFRTELSTGAYEEVRVNGRKVTAIYKPGSEIKSIILYAPADPLPDDQLKWLVFKAEKHGVRLIFENTK